MKSITNWIYLITSILLIFIAILLVCQLIRNDGNFSTNNIKDLLGIIISCVALIITAFFVVMAVNAYGHIEKITSIAEEINGLVATATTKANGVEALVNNATSKAEEINGLVTTVTTKANDVEALVNNATSKAEEINGLVTTVTTKANGVEALVNNATSKANEINGLVTTVTTKAKDVETLVNNAISKVNEVNGLVSIVTNSAKGVKEQVTDAESMLHDIFSVMISFHEEKINQAHILKKDKHQINKELTNLYRLEVYKYSKFLDEDTKNSFLLNLANLGDASDIKPIEDISNNIKESEKIRETAREVVIELRRRFP